MASLNQVELIGRLGDDPELKDGSGTSVTKLSVATDESYTKGDGTEVEQTEWHDVTVFGRQAETTAEYTSKGSQVYVSGRLQTSKYEDGDGITRYSTEIVARRVLFLSSPTGDRERGSQKPQRQDPSDGTPTHSGPGPNSSHAPGSGVEQSDDEETFEPDDELPF